MKVLNYKTDPIPPGAVLILRPGPWGNPFKIYSDTSRARGSVLQRYRDWLWEQLDEPEMRERLRALSTASALVCCCRPKRCHGDILVDAMEELGFLSRTRLF